MARRIDRRLVGDFAALRFAIRALLAANEEIARSEGVTPQQFQAMLAICAWNGPMALKDLADQLLLQHSAAVQLFRRLESTGFVRRESSDEDRRLVHVKLTPAGDDVLMRVLLRQVQEVQRQGGDLRAMIELVQKAALIPGRSKPPRRKAERLTTAARDSSKASR